MNQPQKMNEMEALQVLNNATAMINTTRQSHDLIIRALSCLEDFYKSNTPKPKAVKE